VSHRPDEEPAVDALDPVVTARVRARDRPRPTPVLEAHEDVGIGNGRPFRVQDVALQGEGPLVSGREHRGLHRRALDRSSGGRGSVSGVERDRLGPIVPRRRRGDEIFGLRAFVVEEHREHEDARRDPGGERRGRGDPTARAGIRPSPALRNPRRKRPGIRRRFLGGTPMRILRRSSPRVSCDRTVADVRPILAATSSMSQSSRYRSRTTSRYGSLSPFTSTVSCSRSCLRSSSSSTEGVRSGRATIRSRSARRRSLCFERRAAWTIARRNQPPRFRTCSGG
jgi:hypothetical protein